MSDKTGPREMPPDLVSQTAPVVHSMDLFREKKLVLIRHNDDWYKLMITKQNKLILTK
jgi:hemin uptake protein HemP